MFILCHDRMWMDLIQRKQCLGLCSYELYPFDEVLCSAMSFVSLGCSLLQKVSLCWRQTFCPNNFILFVEYFAIWIQLLMGVLVWMILTWLLIPPASWTVKLLFLINPAPKLTWSAAYRCSNQWHHSSGSGPLLLWRNGLSGYGVRSFQSVFSKVHLSRLRVTRANCNHSAHSRRWIDCTYSTSASSHERFSKRLPHF